jgi:cell wall-associated NlpC family hydrolase
LRTARRLLRALVVSAVVAGFIIPASAASAKPTPKSLEAQINAEQTAFDKLVDQYDGVDQQLTDNLAAEKKLQTQIEPAQLASQSAQLKLGLYAAQAYKAGPVDRLSALLSSSNTNDMLNTMTALNEVALSQKQQMTLYTQAITSYSAEKQRLDALITAETAQRKSLAAQKATIKAKIVKLEALRKKATGSSTAAPGGTSGHAPSFPGRGGKVVDFVYAQLGKPYVFGAAGPSSYDCSGLVVAAYRSVGITIYHQTGHMWSDESNIKHISRSQLEPGDIVFYQRGDVHHVAIYVGNGKVIHAPTPGDHVRIAGMDMMSEEGYGRVV